MSNSQGTFGPTESWALVVVVVVVMLSWYSSPGASERGLGHDRIQ
jgi:hypothetical protein